MDTVTDIKPEVNQRRSASALPVAEYITRQIILSGKLQSEIAREAGFPKANMISMIKTGTTKIPTAKIVPLAKALGLDPTHLMRLALREYEPDLARVLEEEILTQPMLTKNELDFIDLVRRSNVVNPKISTEEDRRRLLEFVGTLKSDDSLDE